MEKKKHDIQQLIGNTLRWGVTVACVIAFIGGVIYLFQHGMDPMPDYTHFDYDEVHPESYTTLSGIWEGLLSMKSQSWIQLGVIALILTPILRVIFSLIDFVQEQDWLYAVITAVVLSIIISNSIGGY